MTRLSRRAALAAGSALTLVSLCSAAGAADTTPATNTATPIKHLVVIFQENVSFDHYFATYPKAANVAGEPEFKAADNTPADINTPVSYTHLTLPTNREV